MKQVKYEIGIRFGSIAVGNSSTFFLQLFHLKKHGTPMVATNILRCLN